METVRTHSPARTLGAWAWKLALVLALVYGALQVLVRTDVFRAQVEGELSRLAGMEVRIGRMRATEALNLKIRDTIGISDVAGIEARVARVRWRLFRPRGAPMLESVRVDGLALTIAPDETGAIQPTFMAPLSRSVFAWTGLPAPKELAAAQEPAAVAAPASKTNSPRALEDWLGGPLVLQNVSVRWQDAQGRLQASVSGMDVVWTPLVTPKGRRVSHLDCRMGELKVVNGPRIADLHLELVAVEGQRFLVDLQAADWGGAAPAAAPAAAARELLDAMDVPLAVGP